MVYGSFIKKLQSSLFVGFIKSSLIGTLKNSELFFGYFYCVKIGTEMGRQSQKHACPSPASMAFQSRGAVQNFKLLPNPVCLKPSSINLFLILKLVQETQVSAAVSPPVMQKSISHPAPPNDFLFINVPWECHEKEQNRILGSFPFANIPMFLFLHSKSNSSFKRLSK